MNRVEAHVCSQEDARSHSIRPLEFIGAENPVTSTLADISNQVVRNLTIAAANCPRAAIATDKQAEYAGIDRAGGWYHRLEVTNSLRGQTSILSSADLIGIASIW